MQFIKTSIQQHVESCLQRHAVEEKMREIGVSEEETGDKADASEFRTKKYTSKCDNGCNYTRKEERNEKTIWRGMETTCRTNATNEF